MTSMVGYVIDLQDRGLTMNENTLLLSKLKKLHDGYYTLLRMFTVAFGNPVKRKQTLVCFGPRGAAQIVVMFVSKDDLLTSKEEIDACLKEIRSVCTRASILSAKARDYELFETLLD